jgi:uncharacterized protein (TIGR02996 family)
MHGPDPLDAFYLVLAELPGDIATLLALSDWYDEQGDAGAAECIRWCARRKRWPFRYPAGSLTVASSEFRDGWFWWTCGEGARGDDWGFPAECRLPPRLWRQLRHSHPYTPAVYKQYETMRQAYEALIAAWPLVQPIEPGPRRRERIW